MLTHPAHIAVDAKSQLSAFISLASLVLAGCASSNNDAANAQSQSALENRAPGPALSIPSFRDITWTPQLPSANSHVTISATVAAARNDSISNVDCDSFQPVETPREERTDSSGGPMRNDGDAWTCAIFVEPDVEDVEVILSALVNGNWIETPFFLVPTQASTGPHTLRTTFDSVSFSNAGNVLSFGATVTPPDSTRSTEVSSAYCAFGTQGGTECGGALLTPSGLDEYAGTAALHVAAMFGNQSSARMRSARLVYMFSAIDELDQFAHTGSYSTTISLASAP
ncbi:MAG: hypothetical protein ACYDCK_11225 [Thermoplasmatota archaeon]